MEERVKNLEKDVGQIRTDIASLKTSFDTHMPHLATKASVDAIAAAIPHLATKAELSDLKASIIQWMVSTMLASAGLAAAISFGLARLIKG
jgi:hypothetical protein